MGKGMKFPVNINPATGRFLESENGENIKESVYLILMTQKGERLARPEFGSRVLSYPFLETSQTRLHMLEREVAETIRQQEKRVEQVQVQAVRQPDEDWLTVQIEYRVKSSGVRERMEVKVK